jgi:hypothetical protein
VDSRAIPVSAIPSTSFLRNNMKAFEVEHFEDAWRRTLRTRLMTV